MKPIDGGKNKRVYIDEHNEKRSRFKVGDRVGISKLLIGVVKYLLLIK